MITCHIDMGTEKLFVCLILSCLSQCQLDQEQLQKALEMGRSHYETYQSEASKDECWRTAVASLNETCQDLSQTARQRLAIEFANCHWSSANRRTYQCSHEMSIASCTSEMSDSAFDVYTQFFNHIEDVCFYLQSQLWQEKTERLITDLSDTSTEAVTKITESLKRHDVLRKGQEQSLNNQHQLLENSEKLQNQIESARGEVSSAFTSIQQQAWSFNEQFNEVEYGGPRALFIYIMDSWVDAWMAGTGSIFSSLSDGVDKIHNILTWLLGEFISMERFVVFIVGMAIACLLTCSKYTAQARPLLMVIIVIESIFLERCIVNWYLGDENTPSIMEGLHFILWIIRYMTAFICFLLLMYFYMSYCNYEAVNHQLLKKIIEQNRQIKRHLKLDTEEVADDSTTGSWFNPVKTSTPSTGIGFTNESAVIPTQSPAGFINESAVIPTAVHQSPVQNREYEISKPDQDSVDGDQPDSGIEDLTKQVTTQCRYNLRKRCRKQYSNTILEHESPRQFAYAVFRNEQLTRRGLHHNSNKSLLKTPCSANRHSFGLNKYHTTQ